MLAWVSETLAMLFQGANYLLTAIIRIGLIGVGFGLLLAIALAIYKEPKKHLKTIFGIVTLLGVGIGGSFAAAYYLPDINWSAHNLPDLNWIVVSLTFISIWILAYKLSKYFFSDEQNN